MEVEIGRWRLVERPWEMLGLYELPKPRNHYKRVEENFGELRQ